VSQYAAMKAFHLALIVVVQLLPGEREAVVTAIPGVIEGGTKWQLIWADFKTADGIVGTPDGGVIFAQEQSDTIRKLDVNDKEFVYLTDTHGAGSVSMDPQGRVYAVQRTCTDSARPFYQSCSELPMISVLTPERRILANSFSDGKTLGRLNDLVADGKGGAYFTVGGVYYVSPSGVVRTVAEADSIRSNGIMLSPDGLTLYVTNNTSVVAFDVRPDGSTTNRRDFAQLNGDNGGDGMAVDSNGRLYVTASKGIHVLTVDGKYLGLIPTPRRPITLAFSGPNKKILYVPMMGAIGPNGKEWATPEGVRNTAMTIYKISMVAEGFKGRPK
jgi:sugar lactone lactonase YvrE